MRPRQIWKSLLGAGSLLTSLACLFVVRYSDRPEPRTLAGAIAELGPAHAEDAAVALMSLAGCLVILVAVCLPPLMWVELSLARHPLSRRMRALLIGQGVVGLVGTGCTALAMALTLTYFGFGGNTDPASDGSVVIVICEVIFALASLIAGIWPARRAVGGAAGEAR